jgi:hypothetical protein
VSALAASGGLLASVYQTRRSNAESRARLVADFLSEFSSNSGMRDAFYAIEYSRFTFDASFHGSDFEPKLDHLLLHLSNLALAWQVGLLSVDDLRPAQYHVLRVMQNPEIRRYLDFLDPWSKAVGAAQHPYSVLDELATHLRPDA